MTGCAASSGGEGEDVAGVDSPGVDSPGVDSPGVDSPGVDSPGVDSPRDLLSCVYEAIGPDGEAYGEITSYEDCAELDDAGRLTLMPSHLAAVSFEEDLASLWVDGNWYYVRRDGQTLHAVTYDNGPDPWQDGLTRGLKDGHMVYFDRTLKPVIDLELDWGWPFEDGLALVCRGCRLEGQTGDEHRALVDGQWGYIDRDGKARVPITGTRDEAHGARQGL